MGAELLPGAGHGGQAPDRGASGGVPALGGGAKAELSAEPCESCAWVGADALELADLLGHDTQGHRAFRALWSHQILSVAALLAALDGDLGLYYLHGQGLGAGGLERIHDRVRWLERAASYGRPPAWTAEAGTSPTIAAQTPRSAA